MSDKNETLKNFDDTARNLVQQIADELSVDLVAMEDRLEMAIMPETCCLANQNCIPS